MEPGEQPSWHGDYMPDALGAVFLFPTGEVDFYPKCAKRL